MKTATTKKPKMVTYEAFKSLNTMLDTMEKRPPNAVFIKKETLSSQRDETESRKSFTGTNTYADAMEIMKAGYKDPIEKMKKAILKIGQRDNYQRPRLQTDFVGFVPHVPNTVMNLPMTMLNRQKRPNKSKTIHLTYNFGATANVNTGEIIQAGINFISLVNSLEKQGYRVKIDTIFAAVTTNRGPHSLAACTLTLKEYDQQLNLLKLAFPLVHPAMLRRVSFKWLETSPGITDKEFIHGYGTTLGVLLGNNIEKEREYLKENGMLKDSYYTNAYEAAHAQDINALAAKMNIVR